MRIAALLLLLASLLWPVTLRTEQLYVVYAYNFMQHIYWSDVEKSHRYALLVLTDNEVLKENFDHLAQKRTINDHPIEVSFEATMPLERYNAIFIDTPQLSRYNEIYKSVEGSQTLLISVESTDRQQIMINILPKNESQYTFEIHRANILNQGLQISDQLILLGGTEIDVAKLYKKTRQSLEKETEHTKMLTSQIEIKTSELEQTRQKIDAQQQLIREQSNTIASQAEEVERQSGTISSLKKEIGTAEQQLQQISGEVDARTRELQAQQQQLEALSQTRALKDDEIAAQNEVLGELKKRIDAHQKSLDMQEKTISEQKDVIFMLIIFISIVALLIFFLLKLLRENRNHAQRDFLTGLYNRRYFTEIAGKCFDKNGQCTYPLSLAMIDIDHFKPINDTYGHDTGDKAIQMVASQLRKVLDGNAVTGRWGGEEFIVLLDRPEAEVMKLLSTIKERLPKQRIVSEGHEPFSLTISVGLYTAKGKMSLDGMITAADALLYKAKKEGRNQIVTSL
jgi:diguanylate cyclase (GGDEF)-like protein